MKRPTSDADGVFGEEVVRLRKELSEMTLEELWELFPIFLVAHDDRWKDSFHEHPVVAKEYETLKLQLWKLYEHNRDAYTEAKTDFISKWTAQARMEYGDRY